MQLRSSGRPLDPVSLSLSISHAKRSLVLTFSYRFLGDDIVIGGVLTSSFSWRATFWFLVIFAGVSLLSIGFLLHDTFRKERSAAYVFALQRAKRDQSLKHKDTQKQTQEQERKSDGQTRHEEKNTMDDEDTDVKEDAVNETTVSKDDVKLTLADVNIIRPTWYVLRRRSNLVILCASGPSPLPSPLLNLKPLSITLPRSLIRIPIRDMLHMCPNIRRRTIQLQSNPNRSHPPLLRSRELDRKYPRWTME